MSAFDKVLEAKYFLDRMRLNTANPPVFKFNLSAFVSAARSVTLHLQKEATWKPEHEKWYEDHRDELATDATCRFFKELRNAELHVRNTGTQAKGVKVVYTVPSDPLPTDAPRPAVVHGEPVSLVPLVGIFHPVTTSEPGLMFQVWAWEFEARPGEDLIALCSEYITILQEFVERFETFRQLPPPGAWWDEQRFD